MRYKKFTDKFIDKILLEVSYRTKDGIVNFSRSEDIKHFLTVLDEFNMGEIGMEWVGNLLTEKGSVSTSAANRAKEMGLQHIAFGFYSKNGEKPATHKAEGENIISVSPDEFEKVAAEKSGETPSDKGGESGEGGVSGGGSGVEPQTGTAYDPKTKGGKEYLENLPDGDPAKRNIQVYPLGNGYYSDKPNGEPKFKILDEGAGDVVTVDTQNKTDVKMVVLGDEESEKAEDIVKNGGDFSEENLKIINNFKSRIEKLSMSGDAKNEAIKLVENLSVMFDESKSKEDIINTLSEMNISVSSNRKKLYLDDMRKYGGGLYKLLGDGTKDVINSINRLSDFIELNEDNNKISIEIEAAAKPDLGSKNIRTVYKKTTKGFSDEISDENVHRLFQIPPLDRIETTKFKSLFGPIDDNGNLLTPSSKHSKEYLKFSIENNISIDNTINVLEKYASQGKVSIELANSVKSHKHRLNNILMEMEIPSKEAATAVDESYAIMFDELMKQNQELASRMLKQFAEMRLYDSEIANGDEAYLPGDGSFPAGDKLVFKNGEGGTERVSFVSVKYGKNGDVYGCPANSKALQTLHPDVNKRDRQGQYIGESGYTLAINDDLVSDVETTKQSIKSMLDEMGDIQNIFSDDEITKISETVFETKELVNQLKSKYEVDGKMDKVGWDNLQKDLLKDPSMVALNKKMQELVSTEKFSKIVGSRNGRVATKYDFGAAHFMSGLSFANQVVTSNGFEGVTHNKQYYDNGTLKSTTVSGTTDRDEWYINFRMYRTAGRSGGGAQVSYIGPELKERYRDSQIGELK